ncbi:MAG: ROK family protein [Hyphomicrobiales bacterium]
MHEYGSEPTQEAPGAATGPLRTVDLDRGTNQNGVRLYNERLVLTLIRRLGRLPKAEIARLTSLSAQTVTGIVNRLERDALLVRGDLQRGRVGQPSVPFTLNPDGALSLGLKIGRRSCDLYLVDFAGAVRARRTHLYTYPLPEEITAFVREDLAALTRDLPEPLLARIAGLGIAAPFELWNWEAEIGAPRQAMDRWRSFEIQTEIARLCPWPVILCNDATAACAAEMFFRHGGRHQDFIYFFVGSFVGGGVVLKGSLFPGRGGNAGAVGSMPIGAPNGRGGVTSLQLIRRASLYVLEQKLIAAKLDPSAIWRTPEDWPEFGGPLDEWIEEAAGGLALAALAATSVIDFQAVIIDGAYPAAIRTRVARRTAELLERMDRQGLSPVVVEEGSIGHGARAMGGAALPMLANFAPDREVLFKDRA